jgi:alanine racemase
MQYSISRIASIIDGTLIQEKDDSVITAVNTDTRQIANGSHTLFFALTARSNGHHHIPSAYKKGIRNFVVSEEPGSNNFEDANFILVKNTFTALQQFAAYHRSQFALPVIGVTGSNGKTIVKEWLFQLLSHEKNIVKSPKSYNSQLGVPLSVLHIEQQHELGIFEAGISTTGEMKNLEKIIRPTIGIFTNIGSAHDEGFESREQKVQEKMQLFMHAEALIYSSDYPEITGAVKKLNPRIRRLSFGRQKSDALQLLSVRTQGTRTIAELHAPAFHIHHHTFFIPFSDAASVENCLHCITALLHLNYNIEYIQDKVMQLRNLPMRLELKYGINNCTIIDDSYSADFHSLQIAIDFLKQQETHKKKTLIISEFEGSGLSEPEYIAKLKSILQQHTFDKIIGVGKTFMHQIEALAYSVKEWYVFENTEKLLEQFGVLRFENEWILLKGARKFSFEKITAQLIGQTHATALEINLNALIHNLNVYKKLLKKDCGVIAMVKAFSYGSGSIEVASLLEKQQVDYLAVAYADEGVVLRKHGIRTPIMVMNPDVADFDRMIENNLEPEIYSLHLLQELIEKIKDAPADIHIKLETGMNRLGFSSHELDRLLSVLKQHPGIRVKTVFSHLAASEDPKLDDFTDAQIGLFNELSERIIRELPYPVKKHLVNSSGIVRFPNAQFDYVRLGIGLYGVDSSNSIQQQLLPIGTLKTRIAQIRQVPKGQTIGYSRRGIADRDLKIAVLAIGYADGYDRRFGNGVGEVFIAGQKAKTIGNICMDMCMADITHIDEVQEGDEAKIYCNEISIIEEAEKIGTIAYELLTRISSRVKRLYYLD